jgi:dolichyl-phosphate-mannose--protein O-mannosyl transferase
MFSICSWDETHFGKHANFYITGQFFFDVHPPLAKVKPICVVGYCRADLTFVTLKFAEVSQMRKSWFFSDDHRFSRVTNWL